jgi:hypothetical protein
MPPPRDDSIAPVVATSNHAVAARSSLRLGNGKADELMTAGSGTRGSRTLGVLRQR